MILYTYVKYNNNTLSTVNILVHKFAPWRHVFLTQLKMFQYPWAEAIN